MFFESSTNDSLDRIAGAKFRQVTRFCDHFYWRELYSRPSVSISRASSPETGPFLADSDFSRELSFAVSDCDGAEMLLDQVLNNNDAFTASNILSVMEGAFVGPDVRDFRVYFLDNDDVSGIVFAGRRRNREAIVIFFVTD